MPTSDRPHRILMCLGLKEGFTRAYLFLTCQFTDFVAKLVALALNGWRSTKLKLTLSSVWIYHIWVGVNNGQASTMLAQSGAFLKAFSQFCIASLWADYHTPLLDQLAPKKHGRTHHLFDIRGVTLCHLGASFDYIEKWSSRLVPALDCLFIASLFSPWIPTRRFPYLSPFPWTCPLPLSLVRRRFPTIFPDDQRLSHSCLLGVSSGLSLLLLDWIT